MISDADAGGGAVTVTLSVGEGTLTVAAGTSGALVSNNNSSAVMISGTVAQINALLNTDATSAVSYIDSSNAPGASTTLSLSVNDKLPRRRGGGPHHRHGDPQHRGGERRPGGGEYARPL